MLRLKTIKFNDISSTHPWLGIAAITKVIRAVAPGTRDRLLEIVGRDGVYDFGSDKKVGLITVRFAIESVDKVERRGYAREVAKWLNTKTLKPLIISDEPHIQYLARPINEIPVEEVAIWGKIEVNFLVPNVYGEAVEATTYNTFPAQNDGTVECFGTIRATVKETANTLKITRQDSQEFVLLKRDLAINDVVVIDTAKRLITVNGIDRRAEVDITSTYFEFPVGEFTLTADPATTELSVEFRPRYL